MAAAFGASSTTDEVLEGVDLAGKRVLVTGVSAGLGVETARSLIAHGAEVVGTVRDPEKGKRATQAFSDSGRYEAAALDLASLASVRACADALMAKNAPFDVIVANAGVMACPFAHTADGFELQFGVNHLGHFVLVNRIASLLRPGGRLVMLSSRGHRVSDVDLDDPNFERTPYDELAAYGRSKTANILFAVAFDRRHRSRGVRATALHPGGIRTELTRHMTPETFQRMVENAARLEKGATDGPSPGLKSVPQGAATSVWAGFAAPAEEVGGRYCEDCHVANVVTGPSRGGVCAYALDPERAEALWTRSEELVGERF